MIDEIRARNVALIRDATLFPSKGLTVLTGETGAGKTALLSACKLLCGERADASTVREGTEALTVEGRFFNADNDEWIVSRRVGADGRSRVSLNGLMASVGQLQADIGPLVDLCGQHEHQRLLKASTHRAMLDAWAGEAITPALASYEEAFGKAQARALELRNVQEAGQISSAKLEEARFVIQRIDAIDPQEGEYEELSATLAKAEHAETLVLASETTHGVLAGEEGAIDALQEAIAALDTVARVEERLGELAQSLREAGYVLEDVAQEARAYRDSIDYDSETLGAAQERIAAFQGLMRAYGPRMQEVFAKREEMDQLITLVDDSAAYERAAQQACDAAEERLQEAADALDEARKSAMPRFVGEVNKHLARLEMREALLSCHIERQERAQWTKSSPSSIEFLFQPAEGMQARPLTRIASGGEISRVMLAIKVVLGNADEVETLIFDEVDAGVGGTTARALAQVLVDLAQTHQVMVVTHLPQIAVKGHVHYQVLKQETDEKGMPETVLKEIKGKERIQEIARMLSGDTTEASLKHAQEMLEENNE